MVRKSVSSLVSKCRNCKQYLFLAVIKAVVWFNCKSQQSLPCQNCWMPSMWLPFGGFLSWLIQSDMTVCPRHRCTDLCQLVQLLPTAYLGVMLNYIKDKNAKSLWFTSRKPFFLSRMQNQYWLICSFYIHLGKVLMGSFSICHKQEVNWIPPKWNGPEPAPRTWGGGGVLRISSDRDVQRIFWGLKFSISGFFQVPVAWF